MTILASIFRFVFSYFGSVVLLCLFCLNAFAGPDGPTSGDKSESSNAPAASAEAAPNNDAGVANNGPDWPPSAVPAKQSSKVTTKDKKKSNAASKTNAAITPAAEPKVSQVLKVEGENLAVTMPTVEKVAADLGYKQNEFKKYVDDFAASLSQGPKSMALKRLCARDEASCLLIKDFHNQEWHAKGERKRNRAKVNRFRITNDNIAQAQRFDFKVLVNSLKMEDEYRLFELSALAVKESQCPRNLSAALAVKAEEFFPNVRARVLAGELFEHARHCLVETEASYERLFLRQGLYAYYNGDKQKAREYLVAAKKATNNTERYRVLYWLGKLAQDSGVRPKDNQDWNELMNEFPLSFYAIQAADSIGKDPIEMITQRKLSEVKREASQEDPELNRMVHWLEALYLHKNFNAVGKWASWIVRANEDDVDVSLLHYISTMKLASGLYRSNITMLFSYFKKNPSELNKESLQLMYPRPYFSMIDDAARGKIDTFLVMGLVRQESGFDSRAISRAKAKGLMQIIPQTARRLASQGHKKLLNEKDNTQMGVKYLIQLADKFGGQVELVLAAYNAGPNKVEDWMKRNPDREKDPLLWNDLIPFMETRDYVVSILRNNYLYTRLYGEKDVQSSPSNLISSSVVKRLLASEKK